MLSIALLSTANADTALKKSEHNEPTIEAIEGIRLLADENGHYRGTLLVNQHIMPFIIDTGATTTTIPMKFATEASLPFGSQIELTTAGGRSFAKKTVIERLILGNVELQHIDAILSEYVTEVLIGMNTLKYFHINQSDNKLSLLVNHRILTKRWYCRRDRL